MTGETRYAGHIYCTHITAKLAHDRLKVKAACLLHFILASTP